jgi:phosphatidate cytidylyltransferase
VGSKLGKVKLCPTISPGKTVEGFLGGLFFAAVGAMIFAHFAAPDHDVIKILFLAIFLSGVSVVGDLTESVFKRSNGVKDSGALLPGHGGILDRVDSLLLTSPVLFYILYINMSGQI